MSPEFGKLGKEEVYAALGLGFHVRGEQRRPGQSRFGALSSPRAFGGFGAGSTGCWVDPDYDLGISFLSTGLLEESRHVERTGQLSDMIISVLVWSRSLPNPGHRDLSVR
ncbi:hypothetical protein [Amycolatopsis pigmentata]|uniref:Uncharacterized protein n=1 Tax=Amycolatopsis pigmentata TaxID=450801 RepID=A0ABW5G4D1_9PSEU